MVICKPTRAKIPSRFGRSSKISVQIPGVAVMAQRGLDVLSIGLVARYGPVVPIAVENRSIREPDQTAIRLTALKEGGTIHPILIFRFKLREIRRIGPVAFSLGDQVHHQREKRRLRAAEIVGAIAVRDMSIAVDLE